MTTMALTGSYARRGAPRALPSAALGVRRRRTRRTASAAGLKGGHPAARTASASGVRVRPAASCVEQLAPPVAGLRVTRRGRLFLTLLTVALLSLAFVVLGLSRGAAQQAAGSRVSPPMSTVTVAPGDTLWGIAAELAPETDPRDMVATLRDINGLHTSASLEAGQELLVPAAG